MKILPGVVCLALGISSYSITAVAQKNKRSVDQTPTYNVPNWGIDTLIKPVPAQRALFAERVDKQIANADARDGAIDGIIKIKDSLSAQILNEALMVRAPKIKIRIENLETDNQTKILYHRAFENLLKRINNNSFDNIDLLYVRRVVDNFEQLLYAREDDKISDFVKANANIYTLDNADLLDGYPGDKAYVVEAVGKEKPELMINRLAEFAKESYADPIVTAAAKVVPGTILKYALSTSQLSAVVRRNNDPLVQAIVRIATESSAPWAVLPFLGKISRNEMTVREADNLKKSPDAYYKALIDLKTAKEKLGVYDLDQEIKLNGLKYIREVNRLHDAQAPVRFKGLMDFRAEDLYFMMIAGQDEIYTSSFTWMFDRMKSKLEGKTGLQFLSFVNMDHFRTFVRMCAGYNTLTPFLKTMPKAEQTELMHQFVSNLEMGDFEDLEGAVDVADAYGSIKDAELKAYITKEVRQNYDRVSKAKNLTQQQKGTIVYGLLSTIFNTADNPETMNAEMAQFIPPIMHVPYAELTDSKGRVYEVSYFYGDQDGKTAYASYIASFGKDPKWKVNVKQYWAEISHEGKNPVTIFANRPLPEETGEDEKAQKALLAYLEDQNIHPTVVIHRGHSYYLPSTLSYLTESAKIVMLGSCGGYHSLATTLEKAPDAHIISSKQVGALNVNEPIIKSIDRRLINGQDINWLELWTDLNKQFATQSARQKDLFSDYIPPNRNLGVIFIKAYKKMAASIAE